MLFPEAVRQWRQCVPIIMDFPPFANSPRSLANNFRIDSREAAALYFRKSKLTVERCNGLRCSLTKKLLPVGFIRARQPSISVMFSKTDLAEIES